MSKCKWQSVRYQAAGIKSTFMSTHLYLPVHISWSCILPSKDPVKIQRKLHKCTHATLSFQSRVTNHNSAGQLVPSSLPTSNWAPYIIFMGRPIPALCSEVRVSIIWCFVFIEMMQEEFSRGGISHLTLGRSRLSCKSRCDTKDWGFWLWNYLWELKANHWISLNLIFFFGKVGGNNTHPRGRF